MLQSIASIAQILFWFTVGTVAVLTFLQARKTVLQPLRTEVFKLQLDRMKEVMSIFAGKENYQLFQDAHCFELVEANAKTLLITYIEAFFDRRDVTVDSTHLELRHLYADLAKLGVSLEIYKVRKEEWSERAVGSIFLPDGYFSYQEKIRSMIMDPLLPSRCAEMLEAYVGILSQHQNALVDTLRVAARELPAKCPDPDSLNEKSYHWIHNLWMDRSEELEPQARKITDFCRNYFGSDEFTSLSARP